MCVALFLHPDRSLCCYCVDIGLLSKCHFKNSVIVYVKMGIVPNFGFIIEFHKNVENKSVKVTYIMFVKST